MGRIDEARAVLARFGAVLKPCADEALAAEIRPPRPPEGHGYFAITAALTLAAVAWGLVNFGLLLWLPTTLVAQGGSVASSSALIAKSTLIAAPTLLISTWLFSGWSTKWSLVLMIGLTVAGLLGLAVQEFGQGALTHPVVPLALVILGSSGVIAIILPYTAENYPLRIRGRVSGWIAGCSKLGGLLAQSLSVAGAVPPLTTSILVIAAVASTALILIALFGRESRGRDLRELESLDWRLASRPASASSSAST
jgi:putative MFS transporter